MGWNWKYFNSFVVNYNIFGGIIKFCQIYVFCRRGVRRAFPLIPHPLPREHCLAKVSRH